jgi:hypothetical protein
MVGWKQFVLFRKPQPECHCKLETLRILCPYSFYFGSRSLVCKYSMIFATDSSTDNLSVLR